MIINPEKLNPELDYVFVEIGNSAIAEIIRDIEQKAYPKVDHKALGTHCGGLRWNGRYWNVFEAHANWKGVKEYSLLEYNARTKPRPVIVFPTRFNHKAINYYLSEFGNPGYSISDLVKIAGKSLFGLKLPEDSGMVCSEFINAVSDFKYSFKLNKPGGYITPADIQLNQ
jgi:hypothetical protein